MDSVKSPTLDQAALLNIFRSGAVRTLTRRHAYRNSLFTACPFCAETRCSARRLLAERSHFNGAHRSLEFRWHVLPKFWILQPRVTAKSGWIATGASPSPDVRATLQVAACALGILITSTFGAPIDNWPCCAPALAVCHSTSCVAASRCLQLPLDLPDLGLALVYFPIGFFPCLAQVCLDCALSCAGRVSKHYLCCSFLLRATFLAAFAVGFGVGLDFPSPCRLGFPYPCLAQVRVGSVLRFCAGSAQQGCAAPCCPLTSLPVTLKPVSGWATS